MKKILFEKKNTKIILFSYLSYGLLSSKASKYTLVQSKENNSKGFDVYIIKYNHPNHNIGRYIRYTFFVK